MTADDPANRLIEYLPDGFASHQMIFDSSGRPVDYIFLDVNPAFEEMTGLSRESIMGKKVTDVLPGIEQSPFDWIGTYGTVVLTGQSIRFEEYSELLDRWYQITAYRNEPGCFVSIVRDITKEKQKEEALKTSEDILHTFFVQSLTGFFIMMLDEPVEWNDTTDRERALDYVFHHQHMTRVNQAMLDQYRATESDFLGLTPFDLFNHDLSSGRTIWRQLFDQGYLHMEALEKRMDGTPWWVKGDYICLYDAQHRIIGHIGVETDITAYKTAEKALADHGAFLKTIISTVIDPICVVDDQNRFLLNNPAHLRLLGVTTQEEALGKTVADFFPPEETTGFFQTNQHVWTTGQPLMNLEERVTDLRTKETLWFSVSKSPLKNPLNGGKPGLVTVLTNITQRKRAEEALQDQLRFEKMVSLISSLFASLPPEGMDEGIHRVLQLSGEFFQADRSHFFQFSPDGQTVSNTHEWCAAGIDSQKDLIQQVPVTKYPWWTEQLRTKDRLVVPDVTRLPPEAAAEKAMLGIQDIRSLLMIPLKKHGTLYGTFGFDAVRDRKTWSAGQITLLQVVAELLTNALSRAQAELQNRYLSLHDSLTGLYNREFMEQELERIHRERSFPISLIMIDLNGLKLVNDTYGHLVGDDLLKQAAAVIQQPCRQQNLIGRWGGDEFVVLLPRTGKEEARALGRRIQDLCQVTVVHQLPLSIALGTATILQPDTPWSDLLKKAEDRLNTSKLTEDRSGKHTVLSALFSTLAIKSFETEAHTLRMRDTALSIGRKLNLSDHELSRLQLLITLHDIGKVVVPEEILIKPAPLTPEEWKFILKHPETGYRIALSTPEFAHVAEDILCHHERWDGLGYPRGLSGKAIPLLARITAIADAYEVMVNGRSYKKAMTHPEATLEMKRCSGTQFDPELITIFLE